MQNIWILPKFFGFLDESVSTFTESITINLVSALRDLKQGLVYKDFWNETTF